MINKKGMTLVELLVYIVLAALVLTPVIMLMNNSSVNMARDAGRVNLQMSGREILQIMYDDLKNTGFKIRPDVAGGYFQCDTSATIFYDGINYFIKYSGTASNIGKCCCESCDYCGYVGANGSKCPDTTYPIPNGRGGDTSVTVINPNRVEFIKDSSSFYSANSYLYKSSNEYFNTTSAGNTLINTPKPDGSGYTYATYSGTFPIPVNNDNKIVTNYDTLGVVMGKLNTGGLWEGDAAYKITYKVQDPDKLMLVRTVTIGSSPKRETVLAKNVVAFKIRFSDNLKDWYDYFSKTEKAHIIKKKSMQYIKVILVLRDPKKLAATKDQSITIIAKGDTVSGYYRTPINANGIILTPTDQALYERYETVIPIPNNGLYP